MCDLAQIEARVVAWVAGEEQMLNAFRENKDLYCEVASQIFNKPVNKNDHPDERFCGKAAVLGLNYGMGSAKFKQFCKNMGRNLEEDFCQQVVTAYRERYNRIVALWNFMGEGIKIMANVPLKTPSSFFSSNVPLATLPPATDKIRFTHSRMHLPSGRTLKYNGLTPLEGNMWRLENKRKIYSCLLVENAVQAISADILCDAILAIKDLYTIVMTTHDEIVISIPDADVETAQADLLRIMCTPPSWGLDIPLAASTGSGKNYGECK